MKLYKIIFITVAMVFLNACAVVKLNKTTPTLEVATYNQISFFQDSIFINKNKIDSTSLVVSSSKEMLLTNKKLFLKTFFQKKKIQLSKLILQKYLSRKLDFPTATNSLPDSNKCQIVILRNGNILEANVSEINPDNIKYYKCDLEYSPLFVIKKQDVLFVKSRTGEVIFNGTQELNTATQNGISVNNTNANNNISNQQELKTEGFSSASFSLWAIGFLVGFFLNGLVGFLLLLFGLLFGIIGLVRQKKNPNTYTKASKILAILGIALNFITLLIFFFLISLIIASL